MGQKWLGHRAWRMALGLSCIVAVAGLAACAPQPTTEVASEDAEESVASSCLEYDLWNPIVHSREDGVLIQRTPTEDYSATPDNDASYHHPEKGVPYNTYYVKADARGCNACHEDLGATVDAMDYDHVNLTNDLGIEITVQQCLDCHSEGPGYQTIENSFGTLIHGIHSEVDEADCWNCHNATNDGAGVQLWDVVKHRQLRGITPVANVAGDFNYRQDETVGQDSIFDFDWEYWDLDYERARNTRENAPLDEAMFNDWTITVSGEVGQEVTYQLTDLIANAPVETVPMVMQCTYNPTGGPLIAQAEVTGVDLNWLLDQAHLTDRAASIYAASPDGNMNAVNLTTLEGQKALLVYQIDGEPLQWRLGYPVQLWVGGAGAPIFTKEVSDIIVNDANEEIHDYQGWEKSTGGFYNKPNVGLFNLDEGQVIKAGEPFTLKGYASAWDDPIVAVEFSMDNGETWTRFDTPHTNTDQWVTWDFTFTPEAVDDAYVLSVRAVSESGLVTEEPIERLVNARMA